LTLSLGAFALIGWVSAIPWLTALWPGGIPMAPSTALLFLLLGVAVWIFLHTPESSSLVTLSRFLAFLATFTAILLLILSSLGIHWHAEYLGMDISGVVGGAPIGHMSPLTAFCFVILGTSLLLQYHNGIRLISSFWLAAVSFLISFVLIIGYVVGAPLFYGTGIIPPAMTTSLAFLMLSSAFLCLAGQRIWAHDSFYDDDSSQETVVLILVFLMVVTGILSAGYLYSNSLQKHFHNQAEAELAAIADLKLNDLQQWRKERLRDASLFYKNIAFSNLVSRFFEDPENQANRTLLQTWLQNFQNNSGYTRASLLDAHGIERFAVFDQKISGATTEKINYSETTQLRQISIIDFHRDHANERLHMDIAIPILQGSEWSTQSGMLILRVDPKRYLYPLIMRWPIPSDTSESLLVRKDGNNVLFLNDLRFKADAALAMRIPLTRTNLPAAMAIQGTEGIVQGFDYRGVPVLAALRSVPDSPWFLIAKMDLDEVNRPLHQRLLWITALLGTLLLGSSAVVAFIWRNQRARFYRFRYMAAKAVEDSEKRLLTIFENAKDGIMVTAIESRRFVAANKAIGEMLGYTRQELLSMGIEAVHPKDDLLNITEQFQRQANGDISSATNIPMSRKDGSIFYADINTTPIEFGGQACLLGTFRDITSRMQAEARIEHLNRVLRAIRNINQLIVRVKSVDELQKSACDLLVKQGSYTSALIVLTDSEGRPESHMITGADEDFQQMVDELEHGELPACCKAADSVQGVCMNCGPDNVCSSCIIADRCLPARKMTIRLQHQEKVYGYLSVSFDQNTVTDAEEERLFIELAEDLAYSLHNLDLKQTMQAAEAETKRLEEQLIQAQKMEAVGQLAGGVAHDFNNLLTIILGYSEMLGVKAETGLSLQEALHEIHEAANRAKDLTRQLLAFSRKQMLEMHTVDVNQVVENFASLLRRTIGEDIRMDLELTTEPCWVNADISQLEQIIMNLAVNARDAMPDGGILTIETAQVYLDESYIASKLGASPGPHIMLSISDNGIGMDDETVERIFEPFFTTKQLEHGTGLGLATLYGIVKQHGGNIWVYTEPGQGTTFKIYLPAVHDEIVEEREEKKVEEREAPKEGLAVLVVEDELPLLKLACRFLQQGGYQVFEAPNVDMAIDIARNAEHPIHILLTDVIMPKMKGTEVFRKVSEYHPGINVLYMSGYTENVIATHGILKEGIHFLQKPFSANSLLAKISEVLRN
jgi:PAS domain S-box-containing protein